MTMLRAFYRSSFSLAQLAWLSGCLPVERAETPPASSHQEEPPQAADETAAAPAAGEKRRGTDTELSFDNAPWWNEPYPEPFDQAQLENQPAFISVEGNHFVDESGTTRVFQGVSIADPDFLRREGKWSKRLFEEVAAWGANVVRVPVHPAAFAGVGKAEYIRLLDQALIWANQSGLYVIVDWHSIGNLKTEMVQHPMYSTSRRQTFDFWRTVAHRYAGISTFAFYELFNEPTRYNGTLGEITWDEWKTLVESMIGIIYAHDTKVIPLVGGFNWAYDLQSVKDHPIEAEGIAYVSHPYPMKTTAPYEENWEKVWGYVAQHYPLFATEIGYMRAGGPGAHDPVIDDGSYGPRMTKYLAARGASWIAWVFHPKWSPQLIQDWNFTPTESGAHFKKVMLSRDKPAPPGAK